MNHSNIMKIEINKISDYVSQLEKIECLKEEKYYRGFSEIYQTYSTYLRDKIKFNDLELLFSNSNVNTIKDEFEYIRKFEDILSQWMQDFNNPIDMIATAEHRGLKTRFKDWTTSFLIANLFALREPGKKKYYIMRKDSSKLIKVKILPFNKSQIRAKNVIKYQSQIEMYKKICDCRVHLWAKYENFLLNNGGINKKNYKKISQLIIGMIGGEKDWLEIKKYFKTIFDETSPSNKKSYIEKYSLWFLYGEKLLIESKISNEKIANQKGLFELEDYDIFYGMNPCESLKIMYKKHDRSDLFIIDGKIRDKIIIYISKLGVSYNDLMRNADETTKLINEVIENKLPKYL